MRNDILIIPDVHGRTFWKDAVNRESWGTIIFLGDYLDPYPREGIDDNQVLGNFLEILDFGRTHDNVVMLLGNHDMHYYSKIFAERALSSRYNYRLAEIFKALFIKNQELFGLAYEHTLNGHTYLFTHSGVCNAWLEANRKFIGTPDADHLNQLLATDLGIMILAQVSKNRGGHYSGGSIVWGDVNEMLSDNALPDVYQIFGHSQQREAPIITDQLACVDVRRAYALREGAADVRPVEIN